MTLREDDFASSVDPVGEPKRSDTSRIETGKILRLSRPARPAAGRAWSDHGSRPDQRASIGTRSGCLGVQQRARAEQQSRENKTLYGVR